MVLVDDDRGIVLGEHLIEEAPVYDQVIVSSIEEMPAFLGRNHFPEHALTVRPNEPSTLSIAVKKGLRGLEELRAAIARCAAGSADSQSLVQTDMRAHINPTRMLTIMRLAEQFAERARALCLACGSPGFGVVPVDEGLPCLSCGGPSLLVQP